MRFFAFIFSFIITLSLIIAGEVGVQKDFLMLSLNNSIPPFAKLLDPFNGFWQNAETRGLNIPQKLKLKGLKGEVTIKYDELLIPHIFAENDRDLYLAQGYVTASHRLWQMELQTFAAAGRLSEKFGYYDRLLEADRLSRRKGLVYGAQNAIKSWKESRTAISVAEAYAEGVNQYIESLSYKLLPLEYKILNYNPEPWTIFKSALMLKNMANTLNSYELDLESTNTLKKFGKSYYDTLFPGIHPEQMPIVDKLAKWDFEPILLDSNQLILPKEYSNVETIEKPDPNAGSNNWAVSGSKTASGNPILANDPHLKLNLPSIWYSIQLNAPGINVNGASLPGVPMIISGYNDSIAWGVTNAQRDLVDWYQVKFQDENKTHYLLDDKWEETSKIIEKIEIRGHNTYYDTIYYTIWGPVVYDQSFKSGDPMKNYAMRWISHEPSNETMTFYLLNRAKNHRDYIEALKYYEHPAQNFVFASAAGDIAIKVQGKYPLRWKDQGKFLLDGTKSSQAWRGFIPVEHNAHQLNPDRGFVSSANQHPTDSTYPYYVHGEQFEYYRNRRINNRLSEMTNITPKDMMQLQNDNYNLQAAECVPYFLQNINEQSLNQKEKEAYKILSKWDFYNEPNSKAPAYYETWYKRLHRMTWDEMYNDSSGEFKTPDRFTTIKLLKENPSFKLFDVITTNKIETAKDIINESFKQAVISIESWKDSHNGSLSWTKFKNTTIKHLNPALSPFNKTVLNGGYRSIVNATSERNGPSWRMVVELDKDGAKGWGLYPGGQSGNPGSHHYADQIPKWEEGSLFPLVFLKSKNEKDDRIIFEQKLSGQ